MTDIDVLDIIDKEDLWIYDKLILSKKLGYICGPKGKDVPIPGHYIIRPVMNFLGMGLGAKIVFLVKSTENIPDGYFWSEVFTGRHFSVDYFKKAQELTVEGIRAESQNLSKWLMWKKVTETKPYPIVLKTLKKDYDWINVEYIGDKVIEIHLRQNPDFQDHNSDYVIPVWKDQKFIKSVDQDRKGFIIGDTTSESN